MTTVRQRRPSVPLTSIFMRSPMNRAASVMLATGLGWWPVLSVVAALGALLVSCAHMVARYRIEWAIYPYWAGLLIIYAPIFARLVSGAPSRRERIGLLITLALGLYLTKVLHSPLDFTFSDEHNQLHDGQRILESGHLFFRNPVVQVTHLYPALASTANAIVTLTGLPIYESGIIIMAATRVALLLGLFLLYEKVSKSAHAASVGAALYVTNSSYIFFSAEMAYESFAMPFMLTVLFAVFWREDDSSAISGGMNRNMRLGLTLVALLAIAATTVTHHMTSYLLIAFLLAAAILHSFNGKSRQMSRSTSLFTTAFISIVSALAWLVNVAMFTVNYLFPVFYLGFGSLIKIILRETEGRRLFEGGGLVAPLWERVSGLGTVAIAGMGLMLGLILTWRNRKNPHYIVLHLFGLLYIPMLSLRFSSNSSGWETSARSTQFVFIGIGFVLGVVVVDLLLKSRWRRLAQVAVIAAGPFMLAGGLVSGWQINLRVSSPTYVKVGDVLLEPEGIHITKWIRDYVGKNNNVLADFGDSNTLLAYGLQIPLTGEEYGIAAAMRSPGFGPDEKAIFSAIHAQYLMADSRAWCCAVLTAVYFGSPDMNTPPNPRNYTVRLPTTKYDDQPNVDKLADTGGMAFYDLRAVLSEGAAPYEN